MLGLVRENEGVAARILLEFDADAEKIRNEVIRVLSGPNRRESAVMRHPVPAASMHSATVRFEKGRSVAVWAQWPSMLAGAALLGLGILVGRLIWG